MSQDWFEMTDIRRKFYDKAVWIPLRAASYLEREGQPGYVDYKEHFFSCGSAAFPTTKKDLAFTIHGNDIDYSRDHLSYVDDDTYVPADVYKHHHLDLEGIFLVLQSMDSQEWILHQDFVIALHLTREGDVWVCPQEGYIEVARIKRDDNGKPILLEVRAEHLKDYLCARKMSLLISSYRERVKVYEEDPNFTWGSRTTTIEESGDKWQGDIIEIHEGGDFFGSQALVVSMTRTNADQSEDVPLIDVFDDSDVTSKTFGNSSRKVYRIHGALWRKEWIEPSALSPRIAQDELPPTISFIVDASGKRETKETLKNLGCSGKWLWFSPGIINALAQRRGGELGWYTADTGYVGCPPTSRVHFGVNELGLVNAYAKDIAFLPEWLQQIWAGHNLSPEGGVSAELFASQAVGKPAGTKAPEAFLQSGIELLQRIASEELGITFFREHPSHFEILQKCNRFRAVDQAGLYALAKDLTRVTAESIDVMSIQSIVAPPKGEKWGSLKSLEKLLAKRVEPSVARGIMSRLVGIYELRLGDAHLPSDKIDEAIALVGINTDEPFITQGKQLMHACVSSLYEIANVLKD